MSLLPIQTIEPVGLEMLSGASSIEILEKDGVPILLALFPGSQSVVSFEFLPGGAVSQVDIFTIEGTPIAGVKREIEVVGDGTFIVSGFDSVTSAIIEVGPEGVLAGHSVEQGINELLVPGRLVEQVELNGNIFALSIDSASHSISVTKVVGADEKIETVAFDLQSRTEDGVEIISDFTVVEVDREVIVVASVQGVSSVISLRLNPDGSLIQIDEAGVISGIGLNAPDIVTPITFDESTFIIVSATLSSSLTVFELGSDGKLVPITHVTDTKHTRFDDVTAMTNITVGEVELIFVAGSDGGVSVFRLSSSGYLVHVDTFSGTAEFEVPSIASLTATVLDGQVLVFVASEDTDVVTTLSMSAHGFGTDLQTKVNLSSVTGTDDSDILVASSLASVLEGAEGADQFIFTAGSETSGDLGEILDFEPEVDQILFPNQPLLNTVDQFEITSFSYGAILNYGAISVTVYSMDGSALDTGDFSQETFFETDTHYLGSNFDVTGLPEPEPAGEHLVGSDDDDNLLGSDYDDIIMLADGNDVGDGGAGNDCILGGNGLDRLVGGAGDDVIFGGTNEADRRDEIFAGEGDDVVNGGFGNDLIYGQGGADLLIGGFGADTVIGQLGDDVLSGGPLSDLLFGNAGEDYLNGGFGFDRINGGEGADLFFHLGIHDHGSDWIQDYSEAEGDVLVFGDASANPGDFQINFALTDRAGDNVLEEGFVIYRPTGQIVWALVDAEAEDAINIQIGTQVYNIA